MTDHIWMEHTAHGGRRELPDIPYWRANGWEPCDGPPPEPDLTRDADTRREDDEAPPEESAGLSAAQPKKKAAKPALTEESESVG